MRGTVERWVKLLIVANFFLVAVLALGVFLDIWSSRAGHPAQAVIQASASPDVMPMGLAHIPTSDNCVLCHESGGSSGLKIVPAILHPVEGWRRCLVCHTDASLGRAAPGHDGIVEEECLNCHKTAQAGPAITQPHASLHDQRCLDCHGGVAHLPTSMASSKETDCVLCHKPADLPPPTYPHVPDPRLSCRACHQSPEVGGLPIDHALRNDGTCLLCHDIKQAAAAPSVAPGSVPGSSTPPGLPGPSAAPGQSLPAVPLGRPSSLPEPSTQPTAPPGQPQSVVPGWRLIPWRLTTGG